MPCVQLVRVFELAEEERKEEDRRWLLGQFLQATTLTHALTADGDIPPTKAEHEGKKKPNWGKIERAREQRLKHDEAWIKALSDPREFGVFVGMPYVLGEPEKKVKPARETNLAGKFADRLDAALGKTGD